MNAESAPVAPRKGKVRMLTLDDIDGRTSAFRKTGDLIGRIERDLGGPDRLTTGERQLVQRAGVLGAVLEDLEAKWLQGQPLDPAAYCTIVNAQRRVFEAIGLKNRPKDVTPDLRDYVAGRAA